MIFVTVGHQTPFDRLVKAVDNWAADHADIELFAQIGEGEYEPQHMPYTRWLSAEAFADKLDTCAAIVAHAGTGTIIQVLTQNKPLLVLPRRAALGETRNDHQIGTAKHFAAEGVVLAADDTEALAAQLESLATWRPERSIADSASPELIARLRDFINDTKTA